MGIGEALVSVLDEQGVPSIVEKVNIVAPQSYIGPIDENVRSDLINLSEFKDKYLEAVDNESAYEILANKINENQNMESEVPVTPPQAEAPSVQEEAPQSQPQEQQSSGEPLTIGGFDLGSILGGGQPAGKKTKKTTQQKAVEKAATTAANTVAREVTRGIMRGLFGQMK